MDVARLLLDAEPDPGDLGPMPAAPAGEWLGVVGQVRDVVGENVSRMSGSARAAVSAVVGTAGRAVRHPRDVVSDTVATGLSIASVLRPVSDTLSPVMTERRVVWQYDVLECPLPGLLGAAHAVGVTHNDAFLSSVTAGLRRYHEHHGQQVDDLRVTMPVSIRQPDDPIGGNRITLMRFKVPVGIADPRKRMRETHARCQSIKTDRSLPHTQALVGAANLLPRAYLAGMLKHIDFLASNVPGVPVPFYLAGAKVEEFYGFGPTIGTALNITLMSYCGTCHVGVNIDTGAIPDPDVLMDCLRAGFDEVLDVGGPGEQDRATPAPGLRRLKALEPATNQGLNHAGAIRGSGEVWGAGTATGLAHVGHGSEQAACAHLWDVVARMHLRPDPLDGRAGLAVRGWCGRYRLRPGRSGARWALVATSVRTDARSRNAKLTSTSPVIHAPRLNDCGPQRARPTPPKARIAARAA